MEIINLDMTPSMVTPNAHAGQYDSARTIRFMLKNGGVPFTLAGTETITAEITRSDNTEVTVNVANTSSNYVDVVFDDTVCTVKGLYACELRLKDSDGFDIGSKNFALLVQRDPHDGAGVHVETVGPADICTFETTLAEPLQSVIVDIEATGGNGTPDNPNPINGYTEANITRCGVNLFDDNKLVIANYPYSSMTFDKATYLKAGTYTASISNVENASSWRFGFRFFDSAGNIITSAITNGLVTLTSAMAFSDAYDSNQTCLMAGDTNTTTVIINLTKGAYIVGCISNGNVSASTTLDYQIETGNTASDFTPYNGQTYTIAFGQTVFGGKLIILPDRTYFHATWGGVDLGSLSYTKTTVSGYTVFWANITGKAQNTHSLCESYKNSNNGRDTLLNNEYGTYNLASLKNTIAIRDDAKASFSEADFKTAMLGVMFAYELATPFDIDLTPEVISAVVGEENNVFADCGQTTVKYLKAGD